jgi:hypothetical protein
VEGRRSAAAIGCALGTWFLVGCAGNPMTSENFDFSNRPHLLIAGAKRSEVKGLAMGAARAKGWTIVKSTDDLLIVQRPMDRASPSARASGAANSTLPPVIEVTSAFAEGADGVNVGLGATLITQAPGEKSPTRVDYTENYRGALNQSLESLRANWGANHQRVATAIPPTTTRSETPPPDGNETASAASSNTPLVQAWGAAAGAEPAQNRSSAPSAAMPITTPVSPPTRPANLSAPAPAVPVARTPAPAAPAQSSLPTTPAVERAGSAPAPILDASSAVAAPAATRHSGTELSPTPEPLAPKNNMLTLGQAGDTGVWAYYAEQYARLRGCNIGDAGAQLIENRTDGEIYKVSCVGAESYLVKCQGGTCRGLE